MKWLGPLLIILIGAVAVFSLRIPPPLSPLFYSLLSVTPSFSSATIDAPGFRTAAVERGDIIAMVQAAGTLNAVVMVDVGSQISGQVQELYADFRLFTGSVKQIRKAPQIVQNIVTYVVVIAAKNPDEVLLPGMTANLQVVVAKREGVLKVPNTALRFHPTGQVSENEQKLAARAITETSADEPVTATRSSGP
jgi:multidrug efflux pump subunit AcrA (membrane-fusion protein)